MTSNKSGYSEAFVLDLVAGSNRAGCCRKADRRWRQSGFQLRQELLWTRKSAISIYDTELPLKAGALPLLVRPQHAGLYPRCRAGCVGSPRAYQQEASG